MLALMRMSATIAGLFAFACPTVADFLPPGEGLRALNVPAALVRAYAEIKFESLTSGEKYTCSGAYISDSGEILTAGNCIEGCGILNNPDGTRGCYLSINGVREMVEIEATSRCSVRNLILARW